MKKEETQYYLVQTWHIEDSSRPFDRLYVREDSLVMYIDSIMTMPDHDGKDHMYFVKVLGLYPWSFICPSPLKKSEDYRFLHL